MNVFAGFWVDGAVRKPEQRHQDRNGWIVANWKDTENDLDICQPNFGEWHKVYWLDTTPRESLTPEELYSVLKVLWPKCKSVFDPGNDADVGWQVQRDETEDYTPVEWNGIGTYPPPVESQWICITRENVGQYLFCECRYRNSTTHVWRDGVLCGWDDQDSCCLVNSDYVEEIPIMSWKYVEVQQ